MTNITQQANKWNISGDVFVDNANSILGQSDTFLMNDSLEIDFSAVTNVDTSALSLLMEWQRRAVAVGCKVTFANLPASLVSLAKLYGVEDFIPIRAS